jgi:WD40 repeat protein
VWSATDGRLLATLQGHTGRLIDAEFSPDGRYISTSGEDQAPRVWRNDNYELAAILDGHAEAVWQTLFSPDSHLLVTVSVDQTARVWRFLTLDDMLATLAN